MSQTFTILFAFLFPFSMTTLGATLIFLFNKTSTKLNQITVGLASGIMLSASIWSLLLPAFENAEQNWGDLSFIPVAVGFVLGGIFMILLDFFSKRLFKNNQNTQKPFKLFTAITIHNIPEGLAVGFTVGIAIKTPGALLGAFMFTLGIALQNFPEGLATALPLQNSLKSRKKAFFLSSLSGLVEPIFAIAGFFLASHITSLMPWLLSLSAGAMIYVIIQELMPELHENQSSIGTWSFLLGFVAMMLLDVCL